MPQSSARNGMLFALAGFALLSCGDGVIKSIAGQWPGTAVAALRYCFGAAGLACFLWMKEGRAGFSVPRAPMQILRGVGVGVATICFFLSIFVMPLAEATAIQFSSPMITALLSAIFLKERAGWRSWAAVITAFIGVLIVLRPNIGELGIVAILPLVAAFGMAFVMLGNRAVAGLGSALQMQFLIAVIAAPVLVLATLAGHYSGEAALHVDMPGWTVVARCALVAVTATSGHWLIFMGTTKSSAATIAPMVYIQLLVALALGIIFYQNWPDLTSLLGTAIIIAAGLYLWRDKSVHRKA